MLGKLGMILAVILLVATGYGLITENLEPLIPFLMIVVASLSLVSGVEDFKRGKKFWGYVGITISVFAWIVGALFFLP